MPLSHQCPICDKTLEAESGGELLDAIEEHLLDHIESKIELDEEFLDQSESRDIASNSFGENQLDPEILEDTDSDEFTGIDFDDYGTTTEENYSEDEQYGEERYILESTENE